MSLYERSNKHLILSVLDLNQALPLNESMKECMILFIAKYVCYKEIRISEF